MSEPKFTPGPWGIIKEPQLSAEVVSRSKRRGIAYLEENREEDMHNARLISVAPKLYGFAKFFTSFAGQLYLRMIGDAGHAIYDEASELVKEVEGDDKDE